MQTNWKNLLLKTAIWIFVEIILNFVGLDSLADYSEFVFERQIIIQTIPH
jgi:hypothetical protein